MLRGNTINYTPRGDWERLTTCCSNRKRNIRERGKHKQQRGREGRKEKAEHRGNRGKKTCEPSIYLYALLGFVLLTSNMDWDVTWSFEHLITLKSCLAAKTETGGDSGAVWAGQSSQGASDMIHMIYEVIYEVLPLAEYISLKYCTFLFHATLFFYSVFLLVLELLCKQATI